jgi:hypothetical protein
MPEPCQAALKIFDFQVVDIETVKAAPSIQSRRIFVSSPLLAASSIISLKIADPINLTYLVSDNDDNSNLIDGSAVKLPGGGKWQMIILEDDEIKEVAEEDLLDGSKLCIPSQARNIEQWQKGAQKAKWWQQ